MDSKNVRGWLSKCLFEEREDGARLAKIVANHITPDQKSGSEVGSWKVPPKADGDWIDSVIEEIQDELENDAAELGTHQAYQLLPYFKDVAKPGARKVVRVDGRPHDASGEPLSTEPPTQIGETAQRMRHLEGYGKLALGHSNNLFGHMSTMLDKQSALVDRLVEEKFVMLDKLSDILDRKHERDLDEKRQLYEQGLKREAFDQFMLLLPNVVNRFAGSKVLPERDDPLVMSTRMLFRQLKPEQVEKIFENMTDAQKITLVNIISTAIEDKKDAPRLTEIPGGKKTA
jgi:hypothetical protein